MFVYPPSPCAFYLQHNGAALAGAETVYGVNALASRLREVARVYRFSPWEFAVREVICALLESNELVIEDSACSRLGWSDIISILDATSKRGRGGSRDFVYRSGPVPNTGRYTRGRYYRAPRCHSAMIAEAKAAASPDDFDALDSRQRAAITRQAKHVTSRDDVPRSRTRTWKRQRTSRWR